MEKLSASCKTISVFKRNDTARDFFCYMKETQAESALAYATVAKRHAEFTKMRVIIV